MKKVLVLGGKPIGSCELVTALHQRGCYVAVADYLCSEESPAKKLADESWQISTAEVDELVQRMQREDYHAVMSGVHEFNIRRMLDVAERLSLPCYCKRSTWAYCDNKGTFKQLCIQHHVPVANRYSLEDVIHFESSRFPLIVKPIDGSGSRGFHICHDATELNTYYERAKEFSTSKQVLIEDYIPYNAVIIHYTMINGKCVYSGISDKISVRFQSTGASVMGIQTFPSKGESVYQSSYDEKVRKMFEQAGFTNGPIWIEAFYDGKETFIFNEMGYRFGGSLTYYPVRYFTGIDQLNLLIDNALGLPVSDIHPQKVTAKHKYCILPIHIKAGKIAQVLGLSEITHREDVYAFVPVHYVGDEIKDWGSAQQVFAYIHLLYDSAEGLRKTIQEVLARLQVLNDEGQNILQLMFNLDNLETIC